MGLKEGGEMEIFSNEIVFRGHPDKVCDQISDALLDAYLKLDPKARCAIEVMGGKGKIFISGEVTSKANVKIKKVVQRVLRDVGYSTHFKIVNNLGKQSPDIALGTNDLVQGAGDNGMMFGYATKETKEFLPKAMVILQKFSMAYDELRQKDQRFLSDGKAQITGFYDHNQLVKIKTFTICYQNTEKERDLTDAIIKKMALDLCQSYDLEVEEFLINPTGRFFLGGFDADTGLTGRKIVVDSYEGFAPVGGGAFSGKDLTKVDRTGAYKARDIAKKYLIDHPNANNCLVQLSYAIGLSKPLAIFLKVDGRPVEVPNSLYEECSLANMCHDLKLKEEILEKRAQFGHFRD